MINNRGKKLIQERYNGGLADRVQHFMNMEEGIEKDL
jgi:hypothetical protein